MQCHSLPVSQSKRCHETACHKICNVIYKLLVIGKDVMREPFTTCAMSLAFCWEKMQWDCLSHNEQCHSLAVGHMTSCHETASHTTWNITHMLLVIGTDMMRLAFTKCACHSLPVNNKNIYDETAFHHNLQCCSHPVSYKE